MTSSDSSPASLILAGFTAPFEGGFALPCYGAAAVPNSWFVAVAAVSGDHSAPIVGFDRLESATVSPLPADLMRRIAVGDSWQDVFVWKGTVYAGTPSSIVEGLGEDFASVRHEDPLAALDLALAAGADGVETIVGEAEALVRRLHGDERALVWLTQMVVRPEVALRLRRSLARPGALTSLVGSTRNLVRRDRHGAFTIDMSSEIMQALIGAGTQDAFRESVLALGKQLAIDVSASHSAAKPVAGVILSLTVIGAKPSGTDSILAAMRLRVGEAYTDSDLDRARDRVVSLHPSSLVRLENSGGNIVLHLATGAPVIERIMIGGVDTRTERSLKRRLSLRRGMPYSDAAASADAAAIVSHYRDNGGHNADVRIVTRLLSPASIEVVLEVREPVPLSSSIVEDGDVLVLLHGSRASAIGRIITPADWFVRGGFDRPHAVRRADRTMRDPALRDQPFIDVVDARQGGIDFDSYAAVICLVDEPLKRSAELTSLLSEIADRRRSRAAPLIVAPALGLHEPSRVLTVPGALPAEGMFILDTSMSRSPFWAGSPRWSVDRRIAEIVVGAAMLCAAPGWLGHLAEGFEFGKEPLLLTWTENGRYGRASLASESSASGLQHWAGRDSRAVEVGFEMEPFGRKKGRSGGLARIEHISPRFPVFAAAARAEAGGGVVLPSQIDPPEPLPVWTDNVLLRPDLTVAYEADGGMSRHPLLLTAETPNLAALRAGERAGWRIVRYTDRETLRDADRLFEDDRAVLPREVWLPRLRRYTATRGLAVRGLDPRDIFRVPATAFERFRQSGATQALLAQARLYRTSLDAADPLEVALPLRWMEHAEGSDARAVQQLIGLGRASWTRAAGKRMSDLEAAWAPPAAGMRRFAIEDGRVPVTIAALPPGEVPAQRHFFIDGDSAVPALLTSRLFSVWARATASRGTSWASRFSVTGTFETLPIPDLFAIETDPATGRKQLLLRSDHGPLADLAQHLDQERWFVPGDLYVPPAKHRHPLLEAIDRVLMSALILPGTASDLDILERLVAINHSAE